MGLNNLGPLLEVRLVMELSGGGCDCFWGESWVGELGAGEGEGLQSTDFYYPFGACKALLGGTA